PVFVNQPTRYRLVAESAGGVTEAFVQVGTPYAGVELEVNDDLPEATPFDGGGSMSGTLSAGDVDLFRLVVPAGGSVRAGTSDGGTGCATDTRIALLDVTGRALVTADDGGVAACSLIDPTEAAGAANLPAGVYFLA